MAQVLKPAAGQALALLLLGILPAELIAELAPKAMKVIIMNRLNCTAFPLYCTFAIVLVYLFTLCKMDVISIAKDFVAALHYRASQCLSSSSHTRLLHKVLS